MKVLFLHGWQSVSGGVKPTFLAVLVWYQSVIGERSGVSFKNRKTGSGTYKNSIKTFIVKQTIDIAGFSNNCICDDLNTHTAHVFNFVFHNAFLGKSEFRNSIFKNTTSFV